MPKKTIPIVKTLQSVMSNNLRLKTVKSTHMLGRAPEEAFDELTREASRLLDAPLALLTLVDEYDDFVISQVGLPDPMASNQRITDIPTFCQLTIAQAEPLAINDTRDVPMLQIFPSVRNNGVRAHLGIPLFVDGQAIGNCCVLDFRPRVWTAEDIATLTGLAEVAMQRLSVARAQLDPAEDVSPTM